MTHKEKRTYTEAFKLEAIRLFETSGKTKAEVEREQGITPTLLAKWITRYAAKGEHAFPGKGHLSETDEKLRRLERENAILKQECEILKKVVAIFSHPIR